MKSVPADGGNGRLWSGEVTAVREFMSQALIGVPSRLMVQVTVDVHGRSLCADDLVYGFGNRRNMETGEVEHRAVTYTLNYPADEALFRKVRHRGRLVWQGYEVVGEGGEGVEYTARGGGVPEEPVVKAGRKLRTAKAGDRAVTRDGHPVEVLRTWREQDVLFAEVRYLDGHEPGPVGGRVGGTEDDPTWEHRVRDGKVVRRGGDYYNDADWVTEAGLRALVGEVTTC